MDTVMPDADLVPDFSLGLLRAIVEGTDDVIFVKDVTGRYTMVNGAFCEYALLPMADIIGRVDEDLFPPEQAARFREADARVLATGEVVRFEETTTIAGVNRTHIGSKFAYLDEQGRRIGVLGIAREITERKRMEDQLLHDALHDTLTGLPNRALFMEELQLAIDRGRRRDYGFTVLFLDLDRFKVVNDSLGHMAGDELLVALAERLLRCLRPGDRVARLGGDEFTVLLDDMDDVAGATSIADRIHDELVAPFAIGGREVFTSASIGIATSRTGYELPEAVLRDADLAMYRAKGRGGSRYEVFDVQMHAAALARLELEMDLRRAVERQEFRLLYQPVLHGDGHLAGFEALVRWEHPQRGLIEPASFIDVAEETDLTVPMGRWVLAEACRRLQAWVARPGCPELTMGVNVSGRQLLSPGLVYDVASVLSETGLEPAHLTLEITENVLMQDAEMAADVLIALKSLGVRIFMDDFGTGYSSLSYLRRFPLDGLKIDRFFVSRMDEAGNLELVRSILALSRSLGLEVTAEGVEETAQWEQLCAMGCDMVQGFLFAPPLDAEAASAIIGPDPLAVWPPPA